MRALPGFPRAFFAAGRLVVHGLPAQGRALYLIGFLAAWVMVGQTAEGALTFQPAVSFAAGNGPVSVAVADLDGDSVPDLVTANSWGDDVSVLLGNGDGSFQAAVSYAVGRDPWSVAVADLDGDTVPDLVTANLGTFGGYNVSVLLGNGDGSFQFAGSYAAGSVPRSVAVADLDGDNAPDLVTANAYSHDVSVLLGNGDGSFQAAVSFVAGVGPESVAVADLNGDNDPDLVTANIASDDVSVLLPEPDATLGLAACLATLALLHRRRQRRRARPCVLDA
jgi:hypothetical protein